MTKTWSTGLAAVLALVTAATIQAAEPPEFLTLPPAEIKVGPLPLDTKAPVVGTYAPACTPSPAPAACSTGTSCSAAKCYATCCLGLGHRLQGLLDIGDRDHPCMDKVLGWMFYRQCQQTPLCCCYTRPVPSGYEWFLVPGCVEGNCGGCCKAAGACGGSCGSCAK